MTGYVKIEDFVKFLKEDFNKKDLRTELCRDYDLYDDEGEELQEIPEERALQIAEFLHESYLENMHNWDDPAAVFRG